MSKFYPDPFQQRLRQALQGLVLLVEGPIVTMSSAAFAVASVLTTQDNHSLPPAIPDVISVGGTGGELEFTDTVYITNEGTDNKLDSDIYVEEVTETAATNQSHMLPAAVPDLLYDAGTGDQVEFTETVTITMSAATFTSVS